MKIEDIREADPSNLDEAVMALFHALDDDERAFIRSKESANMHFGLGMALRNEWGLWRKDSKMSQFFRELGLGHADDMSGVILEALCHVVLGEPFDLTGQVQYYKDYWTRQGIDPLSLDPVK